ncbi:type II toxin-antitoxin system VapC family toxin [Gloeobacter violaceus]|uniref:Gll1708 protein n=1 Tax=Gloeobacter violaceus (strain ATCC 29082 / PCC 7421) TaxID=251221 RepID=Q7NJX3_GLOVI|nr:PIN domain-containing protein [Gloeobacter violaceus]BAC89649.1 gll1708 [Gloeobacter violaceus PCC 7421]
MKVLFDTSVLVPAIVHSHENHEICWSWVERARSGQVQGLMAVRTLAESYAVLTRLPLRPRIQPLLAKRLILEVSEYVTTVPLTAGDYRSVVALMAELGLPGGGIYDALIAQTALQSQSDVLLTLNPNDFTRLGEPIASLVQVPRL